MSGQAPTTGKQRRIRVPPRKPVSTHNPVKDPVPVPGPAPAAAAAGAIKGTNDAGKLLAAPQAIAATTAATDKAETVVPQTEALRPQKMPAMAHTTILPPAPFPSPATAQSSLAAPNRRGRANTTLGATNPVSRDLNLDPNSCSLLLPDTPANPPLPASAVGALKGDSGDANNRSDEGSSDAGSSTSGSGTETLSGGQSRNQRRERTALRIVLEAYGIHTSAIKAKEQEEQSTPESTQVKKCLRPYMHLLADTKEAAPELFDTVVSKLKNGQRPGAIREELGIKELQAAYNQQAAQQRQQEARAAAKKQEKQEQQHHHQQQASTKSTGPVLLAAAPTTTQVPAPKSPPTPTALQHEAHPVPSINEDAAAAPALQAAPKAQLRPQSPVPAATVLPAPADGPLLQDEIPTSHELVQELIQLGAEQFPDDGTLLLPPTAPPAGSSLFSGVSGLLYRASRIVPNALTFVASMLTAAPEPTFEEVGAFISTLPEPLRAEAWCKVWQKDYDAGRLRAWADAVAQGEVETSGLTMQELMPAVPPMPAQLAATVEEDDDDLVIDEQAAPGPYNSVGGLLSRAIRVVPDSLAFVGNTATCAVSTVGKMGGELCEQSILASKTITGAAATAITTSRPVTFAATAVSTVGEMGGELCEQSILAGKTITGAVVTSLSEGAAFARRKVHRLVVAPVKHVVGRVRASAAWSVKPAKAGCALSIFVTVGLPIFLHGLVMG